MRGTIDVDTLGGAGPLAELPPVGLDLTASGSAKLTLYPVESILDMINEVKVNVSLVMEIYTDSKNSTDETTDDEDGSSTMTLALGAEAQRSNNATAKANSTANSTMDNRPEPNIRITAYGWFQHPCTHGMKLAAGGQLDLNFGEAFATPPGGIKCDFDLYCEAAEGEAVAAIAASAAGPLDVSGGKGLLVVQNAVFELTAWRALIGSDGSLWFTGMISVRRCRLTSG